MPRFGLRLVMFAIGLAIIGTGVSAQQTKKKDDKQLRMPSYYVSRNGIQSGPFDERSMMGQMQAGLLSPDDLCSIDGRQEWTELRTVVNASAPAEPVYFYVPPSRIVLFSILSCGAYELYWIYRNWCYIRDRDTLVISPFWRSTFGLLYFRGLLNHIHTDVRARSVETPQFSPNRLGLSDNLVNPGVAYPG